MRLYHVTPRRNLRSISRTGIDPAFSLGARDESWLVTAPNVPWATLHVSRRHSVPVTEVLILGVELDPECVTHRGRGRFTCDTRIPPHRITDTYDLYDVASDPVFQESTP